MFRTLKKNRRVISLLITLFFIAGIHLLLYHKHNINNNYKDESFLVSSYVTAMLAIVGAIGMLCSKNLLIWFISFLIMVPYFFVFWLVIQVYTSPGSGGINLLDMSYIEYLFIIPYTISIVLFFIIINTISSILSKK